LVRLVDLRAPEEIAKTGVRGLAVEEMIALATNTHDEIPGEAEAYFSEGLAVVFAGLGKVLRMSQQKAAGPVTSTPEWYDLLKVVATCKLSPAARQIVIHQFDVVRSMLRDVGRGDHVLLVKPLTDAVGHCSPTN
jgi:hypothetical protein